MLRREIFHKSSTKSIDLFLARNPEFMQLGKLAIMLCILEAEKKSRFRESTNTHQQDWYSYLYQKLTDDLITKEDCRRLSENNVSFITFNYDRSLEHFFYESLKYSFNGIKEAIILEQLSKLRIIHIFGQIDNLDWQTPQKHIKYGNVKGLTTLSPNVRIIYDENKNPEIEECHKLLNNAERIFFLGFGYAKENLELLNIPKSLQTNNIFGTALNLTEREIGMIANVIPNARLFDEDCLTLLRKCL